MVTIALVLGFLGTIMRVVPWLWFVVLLNVPELLNPLTLLGLSNIMGIIFPVVIFWVSYSLWKKRESELSLVLSISLFVSELAGAQTIVALFQYYNGG
jgi:hypothetical protein